MIDWSDPWLLLLIVPAWLLAWWAARASVVPLPPARARWAWLMRGLGLSLAVIALAGPALRLGGGDRAVVLVFDHSQSQGEGGFQRQQARAAALVASLPLGTPVAVVSAGSEPQLLREPARGFEDLELEPGFIEAAGAESDPASAVDLARGLFPPGAAGQIVVLGDGLQTRGDLVASAAEAAQAGIEVHTAGIAGDARPDARIASFRSSRSRAHEGSAIALRAELESSFDAEGQVRLFENGLEVESRPVRFKRGERQTMEFRRVPAIANVYTWRLRIEGIAEDAIPANNEALAVADVLGRPRLLHLVAEDGEGHHLADTLAREGIRLESRPPSAAPDSAQELAAYDGVIIADVPAQALGEAPMAAIRDYVERLGGGLLVIGGSRSYGVGGYYRTPIEELLPVKMQPEDTEERGSTALCLVIDRSGSMSGLNIEMCKTAAIATVALLSPKDWVGVVVFDSNAQWVVPMTRAGNRSAIEAQIQSIMAQGGTNAMPAMAEARGALERLSARKKHMIVLTDGQTSGGGYPEFAAQARANRITISAVAVGPSADVGFSQAVATAGGGTFHHTLDPRQVPRIFTQDAMTHLGRMIREDAFAPRQVERHAMIQGWPIDRAPQLLGYVRTVRRATAQLPLVTDLGDPLLAHWRFGLGKVTAFTSDATSRWSGLWLGTWPGGYAQFWTQVVRETAREPQGRHLDLRLDQSGRAIGLVVDVTDDAASFRNDAEVEADIFHIPPGGAGSGLEAWTTLSLDQRAPGRYVGGFTPGPAGVYVVRARSGADLASASLVYAPGAEVATGLIEVDVLSRAARAGAGRLLAEGDSLPAPSAAGAVPRDLRPWLLPLLLLCFLIDLGLRRWEHVLGMLERLGLAR